MWKRPFYGMSIGREPTLATEEGRRQTRWQIGHEHFGTCLALQFRWHGFEPGPLVMTARCQLLRDIVEMTPFVTFSVRNDLAGICLNARHRSTSQLLKRDDAQDSM